MTRPTCEACPAIDIGDWAAEDLLAPGAVWIIPTFQDDRKAGTIRAAIGDDRVVITFSARDRHGEEHPRRQEIGLTHTAMPKSKGRRPWFKCPICERRCGICYYRRRRFACRTCQDLSYRSQRASYRNHQRRPLEAPAEAASPPT